MSICHPHNLVTPLPINKRYGIRVKTRGNDPFRQLVGSDWIKEHWYASREERDEALADMSQRYIYFRPGDRPALDFEAIERSGSSG